MQTPRDLVTTYLRALERRDLPTCRALLAPGVTMTFPGGNRVTSVDQHVAASGRRFRSALKDFERIDVADAGDGTQVVYVFGTLHGELLSGESYAGIRYIDRFTVRDGQILDMMVWNDMAEILGDKLKA